MPLDTSDTPNTPSPSGYAALDAKRGGNRVPLGFREDSVTRFALFPLAPDAVETWGMYKRQVACFWTVEEIDMAHDRFDALNDDVQHFLKMVLAFFAWADNVVVENLAERFARDVQLPEVKAFYAMQMHMEVIHSETYNLLIDQYVAPSEKDVIFSAMTKLPASRGKADWMMRHAQSAAPFAGAPRRVRLRRGNLLLGGLLRHLLPEEAVRRRSARPLLLERAHCAGRGDALRLCGAPPLAYAAARRPARVHHGARAAAASRREAVDADVAGGGHRPRHDEHRHHPQGPVAHVPI
jgi:hypothetical protein